MNNFNDKVSFIWSVADLLRGPYRPNQYKDVMLPLIVLRRLDCVLEPTKDEVLVQYDKLKDSPVKNFDPILNKITQYNFYNTSRFTFEKLKADPNNLSANLTYYINGFSSRAREIIQSFGFEEQIVKLDKANRLFQVVSKFCEIDLHPDAVSNLEMGYIFEELIRKFNEASNEEAGDHFTPREVIRLMVDLLFLTDTDTLRKKGIIKTLFDPACGTGGMLSVSEEYLRELNPDAQLEVFGQDYNAQAYAICGSDMLIKGQSLDNIRFGDSFTEDFFKNNRFDYMLANPPFGVEWKPEEDFVKKEYKEQGYGGRFGAGLPPINDGAFLFLQHMISKMKDPKEGGTRLSIVFNGSPLFTGSAGSGPSDIRRWIIENDWLEAIVALPDQLFYNTGISTYLFIVTNRKDPSRKGKVQLVDARTYFKKMRKSLGNKRNEICEEQRDTITRLYGDYQNGDFVRIFDNTDFGYRRVTIDRPLRLNFAITDERLELLKESGPFVDLASSRKKKDESEINAEIEGGKQQQQIILATLSLLKGLPVMKNREEFSAFLKKVFKDAGIVTPNPLFKAILNSLSERDETADICKDSKGNPESDKELRDYENIPLKEDVEAYIAREVLPHVPDAWVDTSDEKIGYEINFNRYFYKYTPPRQLEDIEADIRKIESEINELLKEMI